ncbi:ubiquitin carboxyl-terminal hydrolase 37-like [Brienomyrus brachyistius]|uniref:ubiquitin carboxyl-terminal hydrolase 37-like n=1 Tax=Brienomyrus brachyistius TaxID=42636 RepID=UPI0020B181BD|nr:ubiquitin carboxyl-terminal hydrolase 37-like [Brienomyrus brachyistius]
MAAGDGPAPVKEGSVTLCRSPPEVESPPPADRAETEQRTATLLTVGRDGGRYRGTERPPARHMYRLVSVLSHLGSSTTYGHYVSDAFSEKEKAWLTFNAHKVKRADEASVLRKRASSAYVLFYSQQESSH